MEAIRQDLESEDVFSLAFRKNGKGNHSLGSSKRLEEQHSLPDEEWLKSSSENSDSKPDLLDTTGAADLKMMQEARSKLEQ